MAAELQRREAARARLAEALERSRARIAERQRRLEQTESTSRQLAEEGQRLLHEICASLRDHQDREGQRQQPAGGTPSPSASS